MKRLTGIAVLFSIWTGILIISSCKKQKEAPAQTSGAWIESVDKADTIVFLPEKMFELKRGKEISNGFLLPKIYSGLYTYSIRQDSIRLNYSLSSNSRSTYYTFKIEGNNLRIGDFYQKNAGQNQVLIFERMK
jgi:hypothetical protein